MMKLCRGDIVITYPPDFDGELHIEVQNHERMREYRFNYAVKQNGESEWDTLVRAAWDIIKAYQRKNRP